VSGPVFLVDGSELLADAVLRFVAAVDCGDFDEAERFLELVFYLVAHEIRS
jgi:hypothetical protein